MKLRRDDFEILLPRPPRWPRNACEGMDLVLPVDVPAIENDLEMKKKNKEKNANTALTKQQ